MLCWNSCHIVQTTNTNESKVPPIQHFSLLLRPFFTLSISQAKLTHAILFLIDVVRYQAHKCVNIWVVYSICITSALGWEKCKLHLTLSQLEYIRDMYVNTCTQHYVWKSSRFDSHCHYMTSWGNWRFLVLECDSFPFPKLTFIFIKRRKASISFCSNRCLLTCISYELW